MGRTTHGLLGPDRRKVVCETSPAHRILVDGSSEGEEIRIVVLVVAPDRLRHVGVGEDGRPLVQVGDDARDLEELPVGVLDLVAGDRTRLEELGAGVLVQHLLDEGPELLELGSTVDELLAADRLWEAVAVEGDAEVLAASGGS